MNTFIGLGLYNQKKCSCATACIEASIRAYIQGSYGLALILGEGFANNSKGLGLIIGKAA